MAVKKTIIANFVEIYTEYYSPNSVEILLNQRDLLGRTVLEQLAALEIFEFL